MRVTSLYGCVACWVHPNIDGLPKTLKASPDGDDGHSTTVILMTGRSALITGGSGGLGAAVVRAFLDDGWRVIAPTRDGSTPVGAVGVRADLTDEAAVAAVATEAAGDTGAPLRAVVNLVGGYASGGRVHETPVAGFEAMLRLNLRPTYLVTAAALPHLVAAGGGSVVCVSSRAALSPFAGAAGYVTAKAAVLAFAEAVAVEYRADGVRCNTVLPGTIDTRANRAAQPSADTSRWTDPADIAAVIAYLAGNGTVTGARIPV